MALVFCVRRSKAQLVVPQTSTPRELKPLSDIDDQGSLRVQVPILMFYRNNNNNNNNDQTIVEAIKQGLAKALVFYYPLAGRIFEGQNRKLMVNCNEKGVWFVPAKANIELEKLGVESMKPPCPHLKKLIQNIPGSKGIFDCPLLHIQVTRFTCGGFVLGVRFNHTMMDAQGFIQFLNSISELGQLGATEPSMLPIWERELLIGRKPPLITCKHEEFEKSKESMAMFHGKFTDVEKQLNNLKWLFGSKFVFRTIMVKRAFTFGSNELLAMKDQCPSSTTFEALAACLWKCRTIALRPNPSSTVQLTFLVNIRERLQGHKLPQGYYGNAIVSTAATTSAKMLCTSPISHAAELIRKAKNAINDDYVKSMADLMVLRGRPEWPILRNFLIVDNTRFGFDEVDFGWSRPIFGGVVSVDYGFGYLVPHNRVEDKNSVLVALALPPIVMGNFQKEIEKITQT